MTGKKRTSRRLRHAALERMKVTGEKYTTALHAIINADPPTNTGGLLRDQPGKAHFRTEEERTSPMPAAVTDSDAVVR